MRIDALPRTHGRALRVLLAAALVAGLAPAALDAQQPRPRERDPFTEAAESGVPAGFFVEPSVEFAEVYDDNVFLSADDPQSDYVMRLTPGLSAGFRGQRAMFTASYGFDAERYNQNVELDSLTARQAVNVAFNTYGSRRFLFSTTGAYTDTTTPSELNLLSGIITGRARAERFLGQPSFTYRTSPNGRLRGEYYASYDKLEGDLSSFTQQATAEYRHQLNARTFVSTDYAIRDFHFQNRPLRPSHVVTVGVGYALSPTTGVILRAGPRLTEEVIGPGVPVPLQPEGQPDPSAPPPTGVRAVDPAVRIDRSVVPEWGASLRSDLRRGSIDLMVQRTQTTAIGVDTVLDSTSFGADVLYRPAAPVEVRFAPGYYRDTVGSGDARAYRVFAGLTVWMGRHIALVTGYRYSRMSGEGIALPGTPLPRLRQNVFSIGVLATARRRPSPPEPTASTPTERR